MPINRPLYAPPQAQQYKNARIMPKNGFDSKSCNSLINIDTLNYSEEKSELMDLKPVVFSQIDKQFTQHE